METRLGRYCDRVAEAGWLAAALLTPLFFNVYSGRVFEPDKLTLLRSIALVMAAAWLIRTLERTRDGRARLGREEAGGPLGPAGVWGSLRATPLLLPVLSLVGVHLLATAVSVTPRTSFWGSYQRLQGTYTFLAYVVVFGIAWQGLRTRAQLERLLNAIILSSLPVALYGVLQHYGLDPLPWAGDVMDRVTGNLGNAIFIAAYLIMAFFITLARLVARFARLLQPEGASRGDAFACGVCAFTLALQALSIYFSKSRGPWLGLLGGFYVFALVCLVALRRSHADRRALSRREVGQAMAFALLSPLLVGVPVLLGIALRQVTLLGVLGIVLFLGGYVAMLLGRRGFRWLWLSWLVQALLAAGFLVVFNLPRSPLAPLRSVPGLGRLGQVFETETGTGRVRVLIWEGAVEMLKADPLRTLIGYGPESMYVAYSPFYPPDLAHYESRHATPDRSHNEAFDALITTGVIGFLVYFWLFISIFLYGLRWLGFLPARAKGGSWQEPLFLALAIGGAVLGALVPLAVDGSLRFAGVGVPVGMILGVAVYLAVSGFSSGREGEEAASFGERELALAGVLAMIVGHFVEIHFGIAISATRLYFWLGLAVLLTLGSGRLDAEGASQPSPTTVQVEPVEGHRRKRRRHEPRPPQRGSRENGAGWPLAGAVAAGLVCGLVLGTLFYNYGTNPAGELGALETVALSLTTIRVPGGERLFSPGILAVFLLTLTLGAVLVVDDEHAAGRSAPSGWWPKALGCYLAVALGVSLSYGLWHGSRLQPGRDAGNVILWYYAFALGVVAVLGLFLPGRGRSLAQWQKDRLCAQPLLAVLVYPALIVVTGLLVRHNARVVQADIYYKQGWDGFHRPVFESLTGGRTDAAMARRYYDAAMYYYDRALACAPEEDYYYLFLGKALLEKTGIVEDAQVREQHFLEAERVLKRARDLNPLNTDHSANLARLYRTWAQSCEEAARPEKLALAASYYEQANRLSPHNVVLLNEWGELLLDMGRPEESLATYERSLALDDRFAQTYMLLGDYYTRQKDLARAREYYEQAVALDPRSMLAHSALGYVYSQLGMVPEAISENLRVLDIRPQDYASLKNLTLLYRQAGQLEDALAAATAAREVAPEADRPAFDQLIAEIQASIKAEARP
ncbi:MAG: tetratricopeptide repeat protein [Anaerolineae bacterium]|nr:tetratricopeptide repeat protein [Anaerolineae bacterium]